MEALANETHVWSVRLCAGLLDELPEVLEPAELERAHRFVLAIHGVQFRCARTALRILLGCYLDQPPDRIRFEYGSHGKPAVPGLRFNISHSGDLALVALSSAAEVGIDLERKREVGWASDIANSWFSVAEQRALAGATDRSTAFLRCWTRKEAVIKALGGGLSIDLRSFDVSLNPASARLLEVRGGDTNADDWQLHDLSEDGHVGALALLRAPTAHAVRRFDFRAEPSRRELRRQVQKKRC